VKNSLSALASPFVPRYGLYLSQPSQLPKLQPALQGGLYLWLGRIMVGEPRSACYGCRGVVSRVGRCKLILHLLSHADTESVNATFQIP